MKARKDKLFAEVALNLPLTRHLHYRIPGHLTSSVEVGKRVLVPLGKRKATGYVVGVIPRSEVSDIKDIVDVLVYDGSFKIKKYAYDAVFSFAEPAEAERLSQAMDKLTAIKGVDVKAARRRIADKLIEDNQYKF